MHERVQTLGVPSVLVEEDSYFKGQLTVTGIGFGPCTREIADRITAGECRLI